MMMNCLHVCHKRQCFTKFLPTIFTGELLFYLIYRPYMCLKIH